MLRGANPTTDFFLNALLKTMSKVLLVSLLVLSACGRSSQEATPTPLPPTQAELAARSTQVPPTEEVTGEITEEITEDSAENGAESTREISMTTDNGLQYTEHRAGSGPKPQVGEIVAIHFTGLLEDGTVFDSSRSRGEPIQFPLGSGYVIPGWDEGIALMNEGGQATLVIPPALAYGEEGYGEVIPPNATLTFDIELLDISPGSPAAPTAVDEARYTTTEQGVQYVDLVAGDGPAVINGQLMVIHYTGWLEDGTKFESSIDLAEAFTFNLGMGQVIAGWDIGLRGMKVGATRQLVIPPQFGYGEEGYPPVIPPNATLIFEIELLEVQ